jgi:methylglutaconyl-CoA hydratase
LTGETFDAGMAYEIGLIHVLSAPEALDEAVNRQIELILRAGPIAVREAKRLIRNVERNLNTDSLVETTSDLLARLRVSPEGQEGVSAFLERRKPSWL